ncbi:MarR family winged helix-turn-helix transcriptional regulator [Kribbella soli]|uniref:MarR family transcriptional regulator n=1 Tax=Kribbella soli TaxID=1124743 RepID=A0A4R0HF36_9ACTN|nr:hypothetical protein [Kribbella soli]TCC07462.1 hypothetical protein E0H45_15860 [Kribbella soli]
MTNNGALGDDGRDSRRELEPPLSTLLAQALIAYRIELDNEFEGQLARSGFPGFKLPVVFWPLLRHVDDPGTTVVALLERTGWTEKDLFPMIGGVERWGYVEVRLEADEPIREPSRDGYGSSRRLRGTSVLVPKAVCRRAKELWPPIIAATDDRWTERFGRDAMGELRSSLAAITGTAAEGSIADPPAAALEAFAREVETDSPLPMAIAANFLPALSADPIRVRELPLRTGVTGRPVVPALGVLERSGMITVSPAETGRGKVVTLTPAGLRERHAYAERVTQVERTWRARHGAAVIEALRGALEAMRSRLADGLHPPEGCWRASREYAAQTRAILDDPRSALPRHPVGPWLTTS